MKKRYDVICVGSATVDCFVKTSFDIDKIKHGSKMLIDDIQLLTGGGGTNVGVGLARLGMRTGLISEIGDDHSATIIHSELKKEGVDFIVKHHSRHRTAYSVILEANKQDRAILTYKGASSYLHKNEIDKSTLNTKWFYFGSLMGDSFDTMKYLANIAKKKPSKINIYFNPSSYMVKQGQKFLGPVIKKTDILALNKEEAQILLKKKTNNKDMLLQELQDLGPKICIITDGKKGVSVFDGECFYNLQANKVKAVDTTGAGDAFGSGFLAGMILAEKEQSEDQIKFAMSLGIANAESVIGHLGTKTGLLYRSRTRKTAKK